MTSSSEQLIVTLEWQDISTGESRRHRGQLPITLGRDADNTVPLPSTQVSRHHTRLEAGDGQSVLVVDMDSRNGTIVKGVATKRATLQSGESFQVRPFEFTVMVEVEKAAPSTVQNVHVEWHNLQTNELHGVVTTLPAAIGRDEECAIHLPSEKVSRLHAQIEARGNELWVVDPGSRNGIYINEERRQEARVQPGDLVKIGNYSVKIVAINVTETAGLVVKRSGLADATVPAVDNDATIISVDPTEFALVAERAFPPANFEQKRIPVPEVEQSNFPYTETTYLAIGGGLGSFIWADCLQIWGANPNEIMSIGFEPKPYGRYRRLCSNSQIPEHERLRSNSDSCPDNIWGWPGYAVREAWYEFQRGNLPQSARVLWQIFGEPTLAETYTPRSGRVFESIDRESARIGWDKIWRQGRVKAIRKTDDDRYVVAYSQLHRQEGKEVQEVHKLVVAKHLHLAVGYPAIRLLPDLFEYREKTQDFKGVVNAYEKHDHVYEHLRKHGGIVLIRGRGIVASRILQRVYEARIDNPKIAMLHLMRSPVLEGSQYKGVQRPVKDHWELQPFNWPKACWGGDLRVVLERATDQERDRLLNDWGGTTTADRVDWQQIVSKGLREGWYKREFGDVERVERDAKSGKILTHIRSKDAIRGKLTLQADFIVDATGLEADIDSNPLIKDMANHYKLKRNPKNRLHVTNEFEIPGMRNNNGRMYASGALTLGGPYAAVDSFLGLQFAAIQSVDDLTALGAPGLRRLDGFRSFTQWLRWARGVKP